jgi:hypothetical protein
MNTEVTKTFEKMVFKVKEKDVKEELFETIMGIKNAKKLTDIPKIVPIVGHKDYYRIIVATRYRLGIKFENNIVWLLFFGIRNEKTYKVFP